MSKTASDRNAIEMRNLSKVYFVERQKVEALRNVTLDIPKGSIVAFTGKSGAGKSTLLHIIGTLDRPSTGQLFLNGTDVSTMADDVASTFRNTAVGFIFQMSNLLPEFSALENVMMPGLIAGIPKKVVGERAAQLLQAVGLASRMNHRPSELSGGEQQRVSIARALVMEPPILLADEPTGNLDQKTSHAVADLMLELCHQQKLTMLLVTHDLDLARRLPQQVVMEDGQVLSKGNLG